MQKCNKRLSYDPIAGGWIYFWELVENCAGVPGHYCAVSFGNAQCIAGEQCYSCTTGGIDVAVGWRKCYGSTLVSCKRVIQPSGQVTCIPESENCGASGKVCRLYGSYAPPQCVAPGLEPDTTPLPTTPPLVVDPPIVIPLPFFPPLPAPPPAQVCNCGGWPVGSSRCSADLSYYKYCWPVANSPYFCDWTHLVSCSQGCVQRMPTVASCELPYKYYVQQSLPRFSSAFPRRRGTAPAVDNNFFANFLRRYPGRFMDGGLLNKFFNG